MLDAGCNSNLSRHRGDAATKKSRSRGEQGKGKKGGTKRNSNSSQDTRRNVAEGLARRGGAVASYPSISSIV